MFRMGDVELVGITRWPMVVLKQGENGEIIGAYI
jgi:hypothetical protein